MSPVKVVFDLHVVCDLIDIYIIYLVYFII